MLIWGGILPLLAGGLPARGQGAPPAASPAPKTATRPATPTTSVASPSSSAEPVTLTLNDALKRALTANPALGRTRAQIGIAEAQKKVALSSILPKSSFPGRTTTHH